MINWWKRITGATKLESKLEAAMLRVEFWENEASQEHTECMRQTSRANLADEEYKKMEKTIRENSDRVSEWAAEKMRMQRTIETLERKVDTLKDGITARDDQIDDLKHDLRAWEKGEN